MYNFGLNIIELN